jgi:hypothetical protein
MGLNKVNIFKNAAEQLDIIGVMFSELKARTRSVSDEEFVAAS